MSCLLLISCFGCKTTSTKSAEEMKKENFHIYLCFGQSNMEGSATIEEQDKTVNPRFQMMSPMDCADFERKQGQWFDAVPPLSQLFAWLICKLAP